MPVISRIQSRLRFVLVPAVFFAVALGLAVQAQPPDLPKKPAETKTEAKTAPAPKELPGIRLPDGTFLWFGPGDGDERVSLTPQELQKLQDQIDQLKKQLAVRKAVSPSGCAIRGRVDKRGEQNVAVLKLTLTFRTTAPQTSVALGGRKAFLVAAALDGNRLPILDTVDDGFAAVVESAGDHKLTLELEAPVTTRGTKPELGFEIGLPRSAITTLLLEPPDKDVKRVNLITRTSDPAQPMRPPEARRVPALDVKQLTARPDQEGGYPLGPVDSVEVTWDPPAASTQPADQVQSAELDVAVLLTEGVVESTAKIKLRGSAREWKVIAPPIASVSVDRLIGAADLDLGPALTPTVSKPAGAAKTEWKIEFPAGSSPADWVITAATRQARAKADDPKHRGPFAVGPFAVLDVLRQTGTVRVTAGSHSRFVFKHGPDLRRTDPPGPVEEDVTSAFLRLTTGPTGNTAINAPLLTVEAWRLPGRVAIKPVYKLTLTEAGWKVRAEVKVTPIGTEIDALALEIPAEWRGFEASPAELVEGIQQGSSPSGFWSIVVEHLRGNTRAPVVVRFAAGHKQPFELILTAIVPIASGSNEMTVAFPRFPAATERETTLVASVPDGLELRGAARGWEGEHAATWGNALSPVVGSNGKPTRAVTTVSGRTDAGLSSAALTWQTHRPELMADVRADVTIFDRQLVVQQVVRLRSSDGLPRPIRFRGPPTAAGVRVQNVQYPLEPVGPGEWNLNFPADAKEYSLTVSFAIPLPPDTPDDEEPNKISVGLLWPANATRADATVRVWSNGIAGHTLALHSTGWREIPIEPVADRDALPVLALAASGSEMPLILESSKTGVEAGVAAWVERGLILAWSADDGATRYRARFLLSRWLAPVLEVRLPGPLAGPTPEFMRDGLKIEPTRAVDAADGLVYHIPLPESRPGRTSIIEVRYQLSAGRGVDSTFHPPQLPTAAFAGTLRWHVTVPPDTVPLLTSGATAELRWKWRNGAIAPAASGSPEELEHWLRTGNDPSGGDDGESVTARQALPGVINIYRAPRIGFTVACSIAVFGLFLVLTRLSSAIVGLALAFVVGAIGIAAVFLPHPAARVAGACQPGLLVVAVLLVVQLAVRWQYWRRVTNLPGFTRTHVDPGAPATPLTVPSTSRNRPAAVGSTGAAPIVPAGG